MCSFLSSLLTCPVASAMAELTLPRRKSTLSRSINLRAFWTAVPVSVLVESSTSSWTWRPKMPPLALICSTAYSQPSLSFLPSAAFVFAPAGLGPRERIVEADFDRFFAPGFDQKRRRDLRGPHQQAGLEEAASFQSSAEDIRWHFVPPWNSFMGRFRSFGSPVDRLPSQDDASGLAIGPY